MWTVVYWSVFTLYKSPFLYAENAMKSPQPMPLHYFYIHMSFSLFPYTYACIRVFLVYVYVYRCTINHYYYCGAAFSKYQNLWTLKTQRFFTVKKL